jgi:hypothetical protein
LARKGAVQADLDQADGLAAGVEVVDHLLDGFAGRAHGDDDAIGVGIAHVVEQVVLAAGERGDFFHVVGNDVRHLLVVDVGRFPALKVDVRVLGGAAQFGGSGLTPRARKFSRASMLISLAMSA